MVTDMNQGSRAMRLVGWCLSVVGVAWLCLLTVAAFTSDDIALTYLLAFVLMTGAVALVFLTLGVLLIWAGRVRPDIPLVKRAGGLSSPLRGENGEFMLRIRNGKVYDPVNNVNAMVRYSSLVTAV
jgi:hypothetical protein